MRRLMRVGPAESAAILPAVDGWLARHRELKTIAAFAALDGEVDLTEIAALHPERHWAWPRVEGNDLHFHLARDPASQLMPGAFGIREPSPDLPRVAAVEIDAFLCPGLAFDPRGGRLGRGGGFYDRLLAKARKDALKIGVCFPWQIVADTFPEAHDVLMDEILSAVPPPNAEH